MPKKILIIDDDFDLSKEMATMLRDEGHVVKTCLFNSANLGDFKPGEYDIIILDFKMPQVDGIDILKLIPENKPQPKILMISGKPFVENYLKKANLLARVTEVIQKPFSIQALLDKINRL